MFNNPQLIIFGPPFMCHSYLQIPIYTPLMIEKTFCQVLVFWMNKWMSECQGYYCKQKLTKRQKLELKKKKHFVNKNDKL